MMEIYDMTPETLRQDVIEAVIRHNRPTATEITEYLDWYYDEVIEVLEQLRDDGLVCNLAGEAGEDLVGYSEVHGPNAILQPTHWRWCGGPISKALSTAA